jgi:hypothetical protein
MSVTTKFIPADKSGLRASLAQPENMLVALFVLSPTLWLVVFALYFLSIGASSLASCVFRAMGLYQVPHLVRLFPDGSPTPRPTLPR